MKTILSCYMCPNLRCTPTVFTETCMMKAHFHGCSMDLNRITHPNSQRLTDLRETEQPKKQTDLWYLNVD